VTATQRALVLLGAVALAYANALHGAFQFDDFNVIVDNPAVHSWSAWLNSMPGIRPLLKLSYTLNWSSAPGPLGFHLFNIACHSFSAIMVYALCRQVIDRTHPQREQIALLTALLFALHPAQTEAVTYISGRSVALTAVFYLGSLLSHFGARPLQRLLLSPLLFLAALLTKETAWTAPFALVLLEHARGRHWRAAALRLWPHWTALAAGAALILASADYRRMLRHVFSIRPIGDNLLLQIDGWFYLITRPLLALHTNIDPDLPLHTVFDSGLLARAAVLLVLLLIGVWQLRRRPWLACGILWFFLHLLPTNSLLPRQDVANDRQLYLALLGPAALLAAALCTALAARPARFAAATLLLVLGAATVLRNRDYATEIDLWRATAQHSPHKARVWNNLGYAHQLAGDRAAARAAYLRALALDPQHIRARFNLDALQNTATAPE
jgi:protein O-mannosyl-transferase